MRNMVALRVFTIIGMAATGAAMVVGGTSAFGPRGVLIAGLAGPALSHTAARSW